MVRGFQNGNFALKKNGRESGLIVKKLFALALVLATALPAVASKAEQCPNCGGVLSIGATSCTFFGILGGNYTVENRGDGTFEATGVMTFQSQNVYSPCGTSAGNLALGNQPFVVTGDIGGKEINIATYGADSAANYAEGTGAGITCQAPIQNFITSGTGKEISNK